MAITPTFLHNLETGMRVIGNQEYNRLVPTVAEVWQFARRLPTQQAKERLIWMLDTAGIRYVDKGHGQVRFEELLSTYTEFEPKGASSGFEVEQVKLEDLDNTGVAGGEGIRQATAWVRQASAMAAYWPRKVLLEAVRNGDQATSAAYPTLTYDGKKFFDASHPVNPVEDNGVSFNNIFTGAASGAYPGAIDIGSVTLDVAFTNLAKAIAYIEGAILMPNGQDPRLLKVNGLWVPPALKTRAQQLTNAKVIAQAAASGGGGADVEAIVNNWGLGQPHVVPELGSAFTNGSDTSFYITCEGITSDELGAITYVDREPFSIVYNTGMTDAQLQRASRLQWTIKGRNGIGYGHPFLMFKCKAA